MVLDEVQTASPLRTVRQSGSKGDLYHLGFDDFGAQLQFDSSRIS